jgi:hypothetical protein
MAKIISGLFLSVVFSSSALAVAPPAAAPAPEVTGGILGMIAATGVAYLLKRRGSSQS